MRWFPIAVVMLMASCKGRSRDPSSCTAVADHVLSLVVPADAYARDVREVVKTRCEQDAWPAAMRRCLLDTKGIQSPQHCKQQLPAEHAKRLDDDLAAAERREHGRVVPPVCLAYEQLIAKVGTCDALPKEVRDSLAQRLAAAKQEWTVAADKSPFGPVCASALRAVRVAASECPGVAPTKE